MNSRNTRGPAYGRNRGRGLLAPHRAGCPGPAVLLPVPGGLFHSEPDVRIKGPGRLLPASDDKYCPCRQGALVPKAGARHGPDFWRATFTPPPAADPGRPPQFPPPGRILCCGSDGEQQVGVGGERPAVRAGEGLQLIAARRAVSISGINTSWLYRIASAASAGIADRSVSSLSEAAIRASVKLPRSGRQC